MNTQPDVYLFGQVLGTHSFLLKGGFLQPDEYAEIGAQYFLPGGETGTAATVLDSLGVSVRMDGTWIGTEVAPMLQAFYRDRKVDLSPLHIWKDDPGVMDYVVIAGLVRSPMGRFQTLFSSGKRWWSIPQEKDIVGCKAVAIDPFFGKESLQAMEICRKHGIPYVTIDCRSECGIQGMHRPVLRGHKTGSRHGADDGNRRGPDHPHPGRRRNALREKRRRNPSDEAL